MKRMRFYHKFVYRLFYFTWDDLLTNRPDYVLAIRNHLSGWIERHHPQMETKNNGKYRNALIDIVAINKADYPSADAYIENIIGIAKEVLE